MKKHIIAGLVFGASLALDIVTKYLVVKNIPLHERVDVMGSFVQFTLLYNRGGVFGILQGYQSYFLAISIVVFILLIIFYIFEKDKTVLFCSSMALILSGAIGNIIDRLMGRQGVVDFIFIGSDEVYRWPAFNVADSVIVVGAALLLIVFFREEKRRRLEKSGQ
jgi:signal peptidase II